MQKTTIQYKVKEIVLQSDLGTLKINGTANTLIVGDNLTINNWEDSDDAGGVQEKTKGSSPVGQI